MFILHVDTYEVIGFLPLSFQAGCAVVTIPESVVIGIVGSWLGNITAPLLIWLRVDDAVGATCVHGKHPSVPRMRRTRGLFPADGRRSPGTGHLDIDLGWDDLDGVFHYFA